MTTDGITGMVVCESCGCVKEDSTFTAAWDAATGEGFGSFVSATDTGARASRLYSARRNGRWVHSNGEYDYHERKQVCMFLCFFSSFIISGAHQSSNFIFLIKVREDTGREIDYYFSNVEGQVILFTYNFFFLKYVYYMPV